MRAPPQPHFTWALGFHSGLYVCKAGAGLMEPSPQNSILKSKERHQDAQRDFRSGWWGRHGSVSAAGASRGESLPGRSHGAESLITLKAFEGPSLVIWGANAGPNACLANALSTGPSPQSPLNILNVRLVESVDSEPAEAEGFGAIPAKL